MKPSNSKTNEIKVEWEVKGSLKENLSVDEIVETLLENRGIKKKKEKEEFLNPKSPEKLTLKEVGIAGREIKKAIKRIKKAKKEGEKVVIYGDYDADGICGTAVLWEALYFLDIDAIPYIPERFKEGYGLNGESLEELKKENPKLSLIITVDNGITANEACKKAKDLGIDVIISDHHKKGDKDPEALAFVHTTEIGGAGVAWILAREVKKELGDKNLAEGLDLVSVGTISDQIPLLGPNRSLVKYGLNRLNDTERVGLNALFKEASIDKGSIGPYVIGFIIAPRLNAMGRLEHAIDSLRLLCTTNRKRAEKLAKKLSRTNVERQKVVEEVVMHAKEAASKKEWSGAIMVSHESYHEGVIGLAASKLVEEFNRPAIVMAENESEVKGSARSISGFNIIEAIRQLDDILLSGGGHPMAAGFSIEKKNMDKFMQKMNKLSSSLLTDDAMKKVLKVDMGLEFDSLNWDLYHALEDFEPTGIGNPAPTFVTEDVKVVEARAVGKSNNHLKLKFKKGDKFINAIAFGKGNLSAKLSSGSSIDVVYNLEENYWNGRRSLQLKVKDLKLH